MNIIKKEEENTEMQTALSVTEGKLKRKNDVVDEKALEFNRRGREDVAQAALSFGPRKNKVSASSQGEVYRVVISKESNEALERVLSRCSEGFDSGTITKSDVANYIFKDMTRFFSDTDIRNLRAAHFNEKKMLGTILRTDADLPEELKKAIRAHYGFADKEKKKSARANVELSTDTYVDNSTPDNNNI